uniref:ADAM metallopeptidase domain 33 n=1 Tax=Cyanoderma ruficeps TaxID=181631 RepID=A0A8C3QQW4_9PASS
MKTGSGGCGAGQGWDGSTAPSLCRGPLWDHPEQPQCPCRPSSKHFTGLIFPLLPSCPASFSHPSPKPRAGQAGQGPFSWQHELTARNFIPGGGKSLPPRAQTQPQLCSLLWQGQVWVPRGLGRDPQLLSLLPPRVWTRLVCHGSVGPQGLGGRSRSTTGAPGAVPISRGLIVLSSNTSYYLRPLGTPEPGLHLIQRAEHLPMPGGTCGHGQDLGGTVAGIAQLFQQHVFCRHREAWTPTSPNTTPGRDAGIPGNSWNSSCPLPQFYRLLNIKVALIGLEVWTERDQCAVSSDANATLWAFLQWKKSLRARKKHDNAQLLTGKTFGGTTIGMAPLEGMCSADNSGGVSVDHAEQPIGAAATMAHEIGHNFGMVHDTAGCCREATPEQGGCVMAAATGHPFPRVFSACSRRQLENYFQKGGGMCLFNLPDTKDLVVARKCGNGFREEGEDCDCGEVEECTNPCCNAHNCTLKEGAQCAHGDCCHSCKLKAAGTMCREAAGSCDLPEFCTGASPFCPANVYLLDGSSCARGQAYCSNGMCMTHQQQCVQLWGPGAWPAPDACFQDVNMAGNTYGNCGKDSQGRYVKCDKRDAMCGKIQCQSSAKKPQGTNTVSIDTTIRFKGREVKCRGTFVYSAKDDQEDLSDPGLVLTGTKCGDGMVCKDRRCQNASLFELEKCVSRCHGHGVCNSNKNCHCDPGWAPPFCEKPGLGGSVDSGPVQSHSESRLVPRAPRCSWAAGVPGEGWVPPEGLGGAAPQPVPSSGCLVATHCHQRPLRAVPSLRCDQQGCPQLGWPGTGTRGHHFHRARPEAGGVFQPLTHPCAPPARPRVHPDRLPCHLPLPPARPVADHLLLVPPGELPPPQVDQGHQAQGPGGLQVCGALKGCRCVGHPTGCRCVGNLKVCRCVGHPKACRCVGHPKPCRCVGHPKAAGVWDTPKVCRCVGHPRALQVCGAPQGSRCVGHLKPCRCVGHPKAAGVWGTPKICMCVGHPRALQVCGAPQSLQACGAPQRLQDYPCPSQTDHPCCP